MILFAKNKFDTQYRPSYSAKQTSRILQTKIKWNQSPTPYFIQNIAQKKTRKRIKNRPEKILMQELNASQ